MILGTEISSDTIDSLIEYVEKDAVSVVVTPIVWLRGYPVPSEAEEVEVGSEIKAFGFKEYILQTKTAYGYEGHTYFKSIDGAVVVVYYKSR